MKIVKVISGGQTGVDMAGLIVARELGIETGGWAPKYWMTEGGSEKELLSGFGLVEHSEPGYKARTKANVLASDYTILIGNLSGPGTALTANLCDVYDKPSFIVPAFGENIDWLSNTFHDWHRYTLKRVFDEEAELVVNVAGNRESTNPGIHEAAKKILRILITRINQY